MSEETEILIVGGGAIGVCSAYYLNVGRDVALVDKGDICSGCSYGNGPLVVPTEHTAIRSGGGVPKPEVDVESR